MILTCNSCYKKFVVPDSAITANGRTVQCGSCGNKWRQFPLNENKPKSISNFQNKVSKPQQINQATQKSTKPKKNIPRKSREISLYSPEYLAKKHGIKINDIKPKKVSKQMKEKNVPFGFYNSLLLFVVIIISISRMLYFSQNFIISKLPKSEFYLNYFFESIRNVFEIWKNLITY